MDWPRLLCADSERATSRLLFVRRALKLTAPFCVFQDVRHVRLSADQLSGGAAVCRASDSHGGGKWNEG